MTDMQNSQSEFQNQYTSTDSTVKLVKQIFNTQNKSDPQTPVQFTFNQESIIKTNNKEPSKFSNAISSQCQQKELTIVKQISQPQLQQQHIQTVQSLATSIDLNRRNLARQSYIAALLKKYSEYKEDTDIRVTKRYFDKIPRVDRVKGINIIYPKFIIPINSKFKLTWDLFMLCLLLWLIIQLPWEFAFPEDQIQLQNIIFQIIYIIDIIICFRVSYFNSDLDEVVNGFDCSLHYFKSPIFWIDLLSSLPFDQITDIPTNENQQIIFRMLKFIKVTRLLRAGKLLKSVFSQEFQLITKIMINFLIFLLVVHWCTLIYYTISETYYNNSPDSKNWIPLNIEQIRFSANYNQTEYEHSFYLDHQVSKLEKYIYTFYSMLLLIYGSDIGPVLDNQSNLLSSIALIGQISLAMIFASMTLILLNYNYKDLQREQIYFQLNRQIKQFEFPVNLKTKIQDYFKFCWSKNLIYQPELDQFQELSNPMQMECKMFKHRGQMLNVQLFQYLLDYEVIAIIQKLKTKVFMPNEIIIQDNESIHELYMIEEGVVEIIQKNSNQDSLRFITLESEKETSILGVGQNFGHIALLGNWKSNFTAIAIVPTVLSVLSRGDFVNILQDYPQMQTRFKQGYKLYKEVDPQLNFHLDKLKDVPLLANLSKELLSVLFLDFMEDLFVDVGQIVIVPLQQINSFYYIMKGTVDIYQYANIDDFFSEQDGQYLQDDIFCHCLDQNIEKLLLSYGNNYKTNQNIVKNSVLITQLEVGECFGEIKTLLEQTNKEQQGCGYYFICSTPCRLSCLTYNVISNLQIQENTIYQQILNNVKQHQQQELNAKITGRYQQQQQISQEQEKNWLFGQRKWQNNNQLLKNPISMQQQKENSQLDLDDYITKAIRLIQQQKEQILEIQTSLNQVLNIQ